MDPPNGFTLEQIKALQAPLDPRHVKKLPSYQKRKQFSYIEGWHAIAEANRIFGFARWHRETLKTTVVAEMQRKIGSDQRDGWGVTYTATVRITVFAGSQAIVRDGTGAGHGFDTDLGLAHESAIKEAETDAMKRGLMTFGNPFGLALYDKEQREVGVVPAAPPPDLATPAPAALPAICQQAYDLLVQAGLTPAGIVNFAYRFGDTESLADVPDQILQTLIQHGIKPTTVTELNG